MKPNLNSVLSLNAGIVHKWKTLDDFRASPQFTDWFSNQPATVSGLQPVAEMLAGGALLAGYLDALSQVWGQPSGMEIKLNSAAEYEKYFDMSISPGEVRPFMGWIFDKDRASSVPAMFDLGTSYDVFSPHPWAFDQDRAAELTRRNPGFSVMLFTNYGVSPVGIRFPGSPASTTARRNNYQTWLLSGILSIASFLNFPEYYEPLLGDAFPDYEIAVLQAMHLVASGTYKERTPQLDRFRLDILAVHRQTVRKAYVHPVNAQT